MAGRPIDHSVLFDGMCDLTGPSKSFWGIDNMLLLPGDISCSSCSVITPISIVLVRRKILACFIRIKKVPQQLFLCWDPVDKWRE